MQQLLDKDKDPNFALVNPYNEPASFKGYPGFVVRKEDFAFLSAFNEKLHAFLGTPEHLQMVRQYGITENDLTKVTAETLCHQ